MRGSRTGDEFRLEGDPAEHADRKAMLFGAIGTIVEFYDYTLYIYLAPYIAEVFFPDESELVGLMVTYGILALGAVMRIAGGAYFGSLGDRIGRKKALTLSVLIMTISIALTSILPTFAQVGILAPILLVILRLVQGFSTGGEYAGVLVLLLEEADPKRRGYTASLGVVTSGTGVLLASLIVFALTATTTNAQMETWGWRVGYWFGTALALSALLMRRQMEETPTFEKLKKRGLAAQAPVRQAVRELWREILIGLALTGFVGLAYYMILTFLPSYLETVVKIDHMHAMLVTTIVVAIWAYGTPLAGRLSDYVGRKPMLLGSALAFVVLAYPMFLLVATGDLLWIFVGEILLVIPLNCFYGSFSAAVGELFPTSGRYSGLAIGYNVGNAVFGSTTPFVGTVLVAATGNELAPAFYLMATAFVIALVVLRMRETARIPLRQTAS